MVRCRPEQRIDRRTMRVLPRTALDRDAAVVEVHLHPWRRDVDAPCADRLAVDRMRSRQRPGTVENGRQETRRVGPHVKDDEHCRR
jgi:hypothetical protein